MRTRSIAALLALASASPLAPLVAQGRGQSDGPSGAPSSPKSDAKPAPAPRYKADPTLPTRADMASAYVRFERALSATPPTDERRKEIDTTFDKLTMAFFSGDSRRAIEAMNELTLSLDPNPSAAASERLALSLRAQIDPPMLFAGWPQKATLEVLQMYVPSGVEPAQGTLRFVLLDSADAETASASMPSFSAEARSARAELVFSREKLEVGTYRIALVIEGREPRVIGRCFAVERALDSVRHANEERLKRVELAHPKLIRALETCRARNQLLTERPSKSASAQFLADPITLQREVASEIQALEANRDPYYRRPGDLWRVFRSGTTLIPLRTFAPQAASEGKPLPLVIALHGAAGDENMFFQGYGGGRILELARERSFILATPELGFTFGDGKRFDALLGSLMRDYVIDENRIYLVGHSMGAGVASSLAANRKDKIAAVVCFAGSPGEDKTEIAPTLVIIGEIDPLADAKATAARIEKQRANRVPIEFRLATGQGHTLPVGRYLADAIDWLFTHARGLELTPPVPR